jgi:hypothetical protein
MEGRNFHTGAMRSIVYGIALCVGVLATSCDNDERELRDERYKPSLVAVRRVPIPADSIGVSRK